jgi:hypothetical protein
MDCILDVESKMSFSQAGRKCLRSIYLIKESYPKNLKLNNYKRNNMILKMVGKRPEPTARTIHRQQIRI